MKKCILLCANCHSELHYAESRGSILKDDLLLDLSVEPKCKACGYRGENLKSLCFHHRNKNEKIFNISDGLARKINDCSLQDIIDEIKKCDLLCRNCHIVKHSSKSKFDRMKEEIYSKVDSHKELKRLDFEKIKKMKLQGFTITEIAQKMNKGKSSIHYVYHK